MLNNVDRFFKSKYPSNTAKIGIFLTWINVVAIQAVRMQFTFMAYCRLMVIAVVELAANPIDKLLTKYAEALGAQQIERLFKPASFSLETIPSPSPASIFKKRCLNMNVMPDESFLNYRNQAGYGYQCVQSQRSNTHGGRHGRYNKNFQPAQRPASRFTINQLAMNLASPSPSNQSNPAHSKKTLPSASASTVAIRPWFPIRGRVLNWDDA